MERWNNEQKGHDNEVCKWKYKGQFANRDDENMSVGVNIRVNG
jgi:hypothetical protein